ncbi:GNAT family N-acetyltransferase [Streptomyces sp. NPDC005573]|uniref:GNAT family N-acetyltransferase n=1 Tax=Streptomyces sp. NPDC005573 TaxID=3156890 RepID=UPI0033B8AAF8
MAAWSTRAAHPADLPRLHSLLADSHGIAATLPPELLADAVARGLARVAESDDVVLGFIAAEMPSAEHARLSAIVVRGDTRRRGVASQLLTETVREISRRSAGSPLISALAAPEDLAVAGLLLKGGFIGTRAIRGGGEGGGLHVHYQYKLRVEYIDPDARYLVPVSARDQLVESLAPSDHAVTAVVTLTGEPAFEVARFERDDPATLQSGEAAAGIAFSGSVLAAITFLLGFAFASGRFPDDVRLLLIGATFSTMFSLIVYASASGELARIRSNSFGKIMKWGNVLSEYGGVFPFLISLPLSYAQISGDPWTTMTLAVAVSVSIHWYERSEFSIAHRFRRSRGEVALMAVTAASPTIGACLLSVHITSWPWTALLAAVLVARTWLYLFRRGAESGIAEHRQWQIRL